MWIWLCNLCGGMPQLHIVCVVACVTFELAFVEPTSCAASVQVLHSMALDQPMLLHLSTAADLFATGAAGPPGLRPLRRHVRRPPLPSADTTDAT